jgi:beta-barrel assembly-enhancing protease
MTRLSVRLAVSLAVGALAAGCSSKAVIAAEKAAAQALISTEEENRLGAQVHQELLKKGMRLVEDREVTDYVNQVATRVIRQAQRDRKDVKWRVHVVDDPKSVNAFATPGGYLYVNSALILSADNEAELAGVLAHEAGHVVGRHAARNLIQAYGLNTVVGLALGQNPGLLQQIVASVLANGSMLAHSRSQEIEADEHGAEYATRAGYSPQGLISFFRKLQKEQGNTPRALTFLQTHPATADRITHLQQYIATRKLTGGEMGEGGLPGAKMRLQAIGGAGR